MGGLLGNYVIVIKIERSKVYKKDKDFFLRGLCREEVLLHFGSKKAVQWLTFNPSAGCLYTLKIAVFLLNYSRLVARSTSFSAGNTPHSPAISSIYFFIYFILEEDFVQVTFHYIINLMYKTTKLHKLLENKTNYF